MTKSPAILLYTADFLIGCMGFSNEETGQYIKLLCFQHQKDGAFNKEEAEKHFGKLSPSVEKKFITISDELIYNKRMQIEMDKRKEYSASRSANRRKSKIKDIKHMKSYDSACPKHMEDEDEDVNTLNSLNLKEGMQGGKLKTEYSDEFLSFWNEYPKKHGKGAAYKEWTKEKPPLEQCLKTLDWQKKAEAWTKENGKYILDPERWIKKRCWEDEKPKTISEYHPITEKEAHEQYLKLEREGKLQL